MQEAIASLSEASLPAKQALFNLQSSLQNGKALLHDCKTGLFEIENSSSQSKSSMF